MNGLTASDVALMQRNNGGWGNGDDFMWLLALLLLGGNGAWGNRGNYGGNPVTEADLCNANSFNELKSSVGRLNDQVNGVNINLGNAICNLGYETLRNFNNLEGIVNRCCCTIERQIDSVNYNVSQQAANTNTVVAQWGQKILDRMCADREADQQRYINKLELERALCGVVRYPNQMTFDAGQVPFWNGQCGRC